MAELFAGFQLAEVEGVPVLWRRDLRFKTFRFTLHARRPLDQRAAARALLPALLLQGTARDPDRPALARRMESLYGAGVVPSTGKMGESHVLRFSLDSVAGQYLPGRPDLLAPGLEFLVDFLSHPRLGDGSLPEADFCREQLQAVHAAQALFNDKARYAAQRALELACAGESMAIPEHGGVAALEALTPAEPDAARGDFLEHGQLWAVAHGALPEAGLLDAVGEFLRALPARKPESVGSPSQPAPRPRRADVERAAIQQSKLVLVLRPPWTTDSSTWAGRVLLCSMLGGGPHSRLFREVREKQSLAYYAQSGMDRHKGLLQVHVGLDESAAERVEEEVMRQLDELRAGRFSSEELETARAGALSSLATVDDSISSRAEFTTRQWLFGHDRTPAEQAKLYTDIDAATVAGSLEGTWFDHSYLLAPAGEGGA